MGNKDIRVAKVLSGTRLVLNVGSEDGIKSNSDFLIYSIGEDNIIDPITGESLGKLEYVKGKGHVVHLQEKMCTIESYEKEHAKRIIKRRNPVFGLSGIETETEEIPSDELKEFDDAKIGDYAKLI